MSRPSVPPVQRRRSARDLSRAEYLRPRDVFELYGIPSGTLCTLCTNPDQSKRIPSSLIPGRKGNRGLRLIRRADMEAWIAKHREVAAA